MRSFLSRSIIVAMVVVVLQHNIRSMRAYTVCRTLIGTHTGRGRPRHSSIRSRFRLTKNRRLSALPSYDHSLPRWGHVGLQAGDNYDQLCSRDEEAVTALRKAEEEIAKLNNGIKININSPKQVSMAIFGRIQSTTRAVLKDVVAGKLVDENTGEPVYLNEKQQRLASLVLECREYRTRSTGANSFLRENENNKSGSESGVVSSGTGKNDNQCSSKPENIGNNEFVTDQSPFNESYSAVNFLSDPSPYEKMVENLFCNKNNQIDGYWRDALLQVSRPSARALVPQLDSTNCPLGFNPLAMPHDPTRGSASALESSSAFTASTTTMGKKGSFLHFCREMKRKHSDCIVLTRCGDFYETFGVDAIMLVEHCGLNAMAGKARAGFPFKSIQASLDSLTHKGFRMAVYEEAVDTDSSSGPGAKAGSKSRLKTRMLTQIISNASPTYMYGLLLAGNTIDTLASSVPVRPYMGVMALKSGYTLVEISLEEQSVRVSDRLTAEAVACRIAAYPPASPLLLVPSVADYNSHQGDHARLAPFLSAASQRDPGSRISIKIIPPSLVQEPKPGLSEAERARQTFVGALLNLVKLDEAEVEEDAAAGSTRNRRAAVKDFTLITSSDTVAPSETQTYPLHVETAAQLGLMDDKAIPSLLSSVLPQSAPAATRRFLRRILLTPPPPKVCEAMSKLVAFLKEDENSPSVPPLSVPPLGKVLSLLRAGQASAHVYAELLQALEATVMVLDLHKASPGNHTMLIEPLMTFLEHESGLAAEPHSLRERCLDAIDLIEAVVSPVHHTTISNQHSPHTREDRVSDFGDLIPGGFLERNEAMWRGRVQPSVASASYERVHAAAEELAEAVANDFFGMSVAEFREVQGGVATKSKNPIVQDVFNNIFAMKDIPVWVHEKARYQYIHPRDRNGKIMRNRYTTAKVVSAMSEYIGACEEACLSVSALLTKLSHDLFEKQKIPAIVQASHSNLILSSAFHHARQANRLGWNCVRVYEECDDPIGRSAGHFKSLYPYWMHRSEAVPNTFDMKGMFVLTSPNMSGKSTLLRATAAASLLAVCGLCAPVEAGSRVGRFDFIFVRGASSDIPAENKSAFGAEMSDIAALLRCCGPRSSVFVDELGRGTSPQDATRLAGAVLEAMAKRGMSGFFATHLHDMLHLPLEPRERIVRKRMAMHEDDADADGRTKYQWTYRLTDGVCTDSMALLTAAQFGLPEDVLTRAEELAAFVQPATLIPKQEEDRNQLHANGNSTPITLKDDQSPPPYINLYSKMDDIFQIVEETVGNPPISIPPGWLPPASVEGQSCVYLLTLPDNSGLTSYYVGETDSIQQRLKTHRSKGGKWKHATALVAPLQNKSIARSTESLLIQSLAKSGFPLTSTHDGRSLRSSRQT